MPRDAQVPRDAQAPPTRQPIALIGAPTDVGAGVRGASMGPEALRVAGVAEALRSVGRRVVDQYDLRGPDNPSGTERGGYRHLEQVVSWNVLVHDAVERALLHGRLPVLLGGDHSLAIGSISAVARHCRSTGKRLRVIWLDAHADCNLATCSPSGNLHGMGVACLLGLGPDALTGLSGHRCAVEVDALRLIGVRSVDAGEQALVAELGLTIVDMQQLQMLGAGAAMSMLLGDVDQATHVHVSFDVDFLDPELAPGVGTAVPGGPGLQAARRCLAMLAHTGRVGSLDVMELNPALDVRNRTASVVVGLLRALFAPPTRRGAAPHPGTAMHACITAETSTVLLR